MAPGKAELRLGKVDSDDVGTSRQLLSDGNTGPATCVQDACPRWEPGDELIQQRDIRRISTTRRKIRRSNAVVRLADLRSRIHALGSS